MFDIKGGKIVLSANALAIPPFKKHYEEADNQAEALKEIEYIIWLYKWDTPYLSYPAKERPLRVAKDIFNNEKYQPNDKVKEVIKRYNEFQITPLIRLHNAAQVGLDFLVEQLESLKNETAGDIKFANDVAKLLAQVDPIGKSLESGKKRAMAEQVETGKIKGGGKLGLYEMPRK